MSKREELLQKLKNLEEEWDRLDNGANQFRQDRIVTEMIAVRNELNELKEK